jgi:hypothetical protein
MARTDPVAHLHRFPEGAPGRLRDEILAVGADALPALERLLDDPEATVAETPAYAAASNAATLYGRLAQVAGLERLLHLVRTAPLDQRLQAEAMFGVMMVEDPQAVTAAILAGPTTEEREPYLVELLVRAGARDPTTAARVEALLATAPQLGGRLAAASGDPALLPAVRRAFDELPLSGRLEEWEGDTAVVLLESIFVLAGDDRADVGRRARLQAALQLSITRHEEDLRRR